MNSFSLWTVNLSHNHIIFFDIGWLVNRNENIVFDITNNNIIEITMEYISVLSEVHILSDDPRFCCVSANKEACFSDKGSDHICNNLISMRITKVYFWLMAAFIILSNLFAFYMLLIMPDNGDRFILKNICLADIIYGLYVLIIAIADLYFGNYFIIFARSWQQGVICKCLAVLSSIFYLSASFWNMLLSVLRYLNLSKHIETNMFF